MVFVTVVDDVCLFSQCGASFVIKSAPNGAVEMMASTEMIRILSANSILSSAFSSRAMSSAIGPNAACTVALGRPDSVT